MIGDYTKVPLRDDERWTGARMQQGRVLLDHEWNLNLDAAARTQRVEAYDVIGGAGVRERSDAFKVSLATGDLTLAAGHIWVGGELAVAPASFTYSSQPGIPALPGSGAVLVYLDVFDEHVQPAEDPSDLLDPALTPIDTAARTRVGYRVRFATTAETSPPEAWRALRATLVAESDATLTIAAAPPSASTDPCAPPDDPVSLVPEGLFRVEVLDGGAAAAVRLAWSFDNGSTVAQVLEAPTSMSDVRIATTPAATFAEGDLVELSWLERRADRAAHGELYVVKKVTLADDGTHLQLDRGSGFAAPPTGATGLVVRRWDGQSAGAAATTVSYRGRDVVVVTPGSTGTFQPGDWWGARVRDGGAGIEPRTAAVPDGVVHWFVQLALVDLGTQKVVDMRPRFRPLVDIAVETCTVELDPDTDLQAQLAYVPTDSSVVCFAAGRYELSEPLVFADKHRIVVHGAGPGTVIVAPPDSETALRFVGCTKVELRDLTVVGGAPTPGNGGLDGAVTFLGACTDVRVERCVLACADGDGPTRTCLTVRSDGSAQPDRVAVVANSFELGANQIGALLVDVDECRIDDNRLALAPETRQTAFARQGIVVGGSRASIVEISRNVVRDVAQGIHVGLSESTPSSLLIDKALVAGNVVLVKIPKGYGGDRHAIFVGRANSIQVLGNAAKLDPVAIGTAISGVRILSPQGPMLLVRDTALDGFDVGVSVVELDKTKVPQQRVWLVEGTMAANGRIALDAPAEVVEEHNAPMPKSGKLSAVSVTPGSFAPGTSASGLVTLDAPAGRFGATIALSLADAAGGVPNVASVSPASLALPAGTTSASFTVTAKAGALSQQAALTVHAVHDAEDKTRVEKTAGVTIIPQTTVASLSLAQSSAVGAANAKVGTTVSLTQAASAATGVALQSSNAAAKVPSSVTVQKGATSASFDVTLSHVAAATGATITASLNGGSRSAQLSILQAPLPQIARLRLLHVSSSNDPNPIVWFDTAASGSGFLPAKVMTAEYDSTLATWVSHRANAIEVMFANAQVDPASVVAGSTFTVVRQGATPQPANERIASLGANTFRWICDALPLPPLGSKPSVSSTFTVTLKGDGTAIQSTAGRRLDGNLLGFPSGDGTEGGNAVFTVSVTLDAPDYDGSGSGNKPYGSKYSTYEP